MLLTYVQYGPTSKKQASQIRKRGPLSVFLLKSFGLKQCSAASATVYYNAQGCSRLLKVVVALRVAAMIGLGFLAGGPILSVPHEATRAACGMFGSIELPLSFTVRLS